MGVKVGNSYVSEAAYSYAQSQVSEDSGGVLNDLTKQFKDVKFSVGTTPFSSSGTNNISIAPNILRQMATNPEKRLEYEALIYDCNQTLKNTANRPGLVAQGYIIGSDGGLRMWGISKGDDGNQNRSLNKVDKDRLAGRLPKNKKSTFKELQEKLIEKSKENIKNQKFTNTKELSKYLRDNYTIVKSGNATISSKYLRECLTDEDKQKKLFENLAVADKALDSHKGEIGFQGMQISIDENGEMSMQSSKSTVTFNEAKRARQLAAAQSVSDVRQVMELLKTDLEDCENGLQNNACDEAEVEKVKKMIERAQKRLTEVSKTDDKSKTFSIDILI